MMKISAVATALATLMLAGAVPAGSTPAQKDSVSVSGPWTVTVKTPHGTMTMPMVLKQEGTKVTGTFSPHGQDLSVAGEFAARTLKLAMPGSQDTRLTLTAKLQENGTLDGYLSSPDGDMTWTAERVKEK
jgi:hypothetical protein